jgi:putative membrane protein
MAADDTPSGKVSAQSTADEISVELSSRRTGMSFQRTRLSADRTLMSVTRTSLALIGFGFTIYQVFQKLHDLEVLKSAGAARHFAELLVLLGNVMLVLGVVYHITFMRSLRRERAQLRADGLIHGESGFPPAISLIIALILLALGILAIVSMLFDLNLLG